MKDKPCLIGSQDLRDLLDSLAIENEVLAASWSADCIQAYAFGQSQLIGTLSRWVREREIEAMLNDAESN